MTEKSYAAKTHFESIPGSERRIDRSRKNAPETISDQKANPEIDKIIASHPFVKEALENLWLFDKKISAEAAGRYDFDTYRHSLSVADMITRSAPALGLKPDIKLLLVQAALVHDIGKIGMPLPVLCRAGKLSLKEKSCHVEAGIDYLQKLRAKNDLTPAETKNIKKLEYIVEMHHQGDNYPLSGKAEWPRDLDAETIEAARLFELFDKYEALSAQRNYKEPWERTEIKTELYRIFTAPEDRIRADKVLNAVILNQPQSNQ